MSSQKEVIAERAEIQASFMMPFTTCEAERIMWLSWNIGTLPMMIKTAHEQHKEDLAEVFKETLKILKRQRRKARKPVEP